MTTDKKVLTFGFTAGTLFDMKECESVYEKSAVGEKEKYYRHYFKQMNSKKEVLKPGPALGLYIALHKLKGKIPADLIKLRFGITTRFDTIHEGTTTLFNSLRHYLLISENEDMMPDYISLTNGMEQASSHKMQGADVVFTSSDKSAKEYYSNGVAAINLQNISKNHNEEMYQNRNNNINFIFDFDGVVADHTSEMVYQAAKRVENLNPIDEFRKHEIANSEKPMALGPLGEFIKKTSVIVDYFHNKMVNNEISHEDIPLKTQILTARGGAAVFRVAKTLSYNSIKVSKADFADGREKYLALNMLKKEDLNLFLEDSLVHIEGARKFNDHVMAGLVFNDYNAGKDNLDATVAFLKAKYELPEVSKII